MNDFSEGLLYSFLGSATVDAETAKAGDIVYTVSSSDPENDVVSYSATCTPLADCPLEIRQSNYSETCLKQWLKHIQYKCLKDK